MRRTVSHLSMKSARAILPRVEPLEARRLLALTPLPVLSSLVDATSTARPVAIGRPVAEPPASGSSTAYYAGEPSAPGSSAIPFVGPMASAPYTPAQIRHAYGFDQLGYDGTGQTIAIIDA